MNSERQNILELKHIEKSFPGVRALNDISLQIRIGEVRGIVGENGAGKSTLMKILTGIIKKDSGEIVIEGETVEIQSPIHAQKLGLSIIFQEFNLINSLSITENIFMGRLKKKKELWINWAERNKEAAAILKQVGLEIDPSIKAGELSVAGKQMVEIAKALSYHSKIIIMDEPSATLTNKELKHLFQIIHDLKSNGVTVIYISHRLDEIFELCDCVTVIRDGEVVDTKKIEELDKEKVISMMVGRAMNQEYPKRMKEPGKEVVLQVQDLCRASVFENISFTLHKGERLGIAGLVGAGRTEIVRAIFGADRLTSGKIFLNGEEVSIRSPRDAIAHKIAFVTEDRKQQGLILEGTIGENTTLAALDKVRNGPFLSRQSEDKQSKDMNEKMKTKAPGMKSKVVNLSGGNQQKVVLAKWLFTDAEILILDEPTRGIDVGAKYEIYQLINQLADQGTSVIIISSEMPEVINISDRMLVIHDGKCKGVLSGEEKTGENVMKYALLEGEV